jgi:hypothetical protein
MFLARIRNRWLRKPSDPNGFSTLTSGNNGTRGSHWFLQILNRLLLIAADDR